MALQHQAGKGVSESLPCLKEGADFPNLVWTWYLLNFAIHAQSLKCRKITWQSILSWWHFLVAFCIQCSLSSESAWLLRHSASLRPQGNAAYVGASLKMAASMPSLCREQLIFPFFFCSFCLCLSDVLMPAHFRCFLFHLGALSQEAISVWMQSCSVFRFLLILSFCHFFFYVFLWWILAVCI